MSDSKIRALIIPADLSRKPHVSWISNRLQALQKLVGGYIETVTAGDLVIICNEEGRLMNLPANLQSPFSGMVGDVVIVSHHGEGLTSLSEDMSRVLLRTCKEKREVLNV